MRHLEEPMKKVTILFLASILVFSLQANTDKSFYDRLENLKKIVDIQFESRLTIKKQAVGLKKLESLFASDDEVRIYFGEDKVIKTVKIIENKYNQAIRLKHNTLYYSYDGRDNDELKAWRLASFPIVKNGILRQQAYIQALSSNITFDRSPDSYRDEVSDTDYSAFLGVFAEFMLEVQTDDPTAFSRIDEIVVIDEEAVSEITNMEYREYQTYSNPDEIKSKLKVFYRPVNKIEDKRLLKEILHSLFYLTGENHFSTVMYIEPSYAKYALALKNLCFQMEHGTGVVRALKEEGVKSFYFNSRWDSNDELLKPDGRLVLGIEMQDVIDALEILFF